MNKLVSDYLNRLCAPIRSKETRIAARAEFAGHIENIVEELIEKGTKEEDAVHQALERMGSPETAGREIASLSRSWTNAFAVAAGLAILALAFAYLATFVPVEYLLEPRAFAFVIPVTLALMLLSGVKRFSRRTVLQRSRAFALYAGGIGTVIGAINALGNIGDYEMLGLSLAFCVTSLLYGLTASALIDSLSYLTHPVGPEEIRKVFNLE